jgi:hypothetical protein
MERLLRPRMVSSRSAALIGQGEVDEHGGKQEKLVHRASSAGGLWKAKEAAPVA